MGDRGANHKGQHGTHVDIWTNPVDLFARRLQVRNAHRARGAAPDVAGRSPIAAGLRRFGSGRDGGLQDQGSTRPGGRRVRLPARSGI